MDVKFKIKESIHLSIRRMILIFYLFSYSYFTKIVKVYFRTKLKTVHIIENKSERAITADTSCTVTRQVSGEQICRKIRRKIVAQTMYEFLIKRFLFFRWFVQ